MSVITETPSVAELFGRLGLREGSLAEERLMIGGLGWKGYLALDAALGNDRAGPRTYYYEGDVELVSTSEEHERIKTRIGGCVEDFLLEHRIVYVERGQATMRLEYEGAAEPDASWCLGTAKSYPDIVLEIALTRGGLPKLEVYRRFAIPEVWIWRSGHLEIHQLKSDESGYEQARESRLLPTLPVAELERAVATTNAVDARLAFRAALR